MVEQRDALLIVFFLTEPSASSCLQTHHESSHHEHHVVNSSTSQMGEVVSERPVAVGVAEVSWLCGALCHSACIDSCCACRSSGWQRFDQRSSLD
jgi:hypothetical protein